MRPRYDWSGGESRLSRVLVGTPVALAFAVPCAPTAPFRGLLGSLNECPRVSSHRTRRGPAV
eukprot:1776-Prymnesium_polylepis.2